MKGTTWLAPIALALSLAHQTSVIQSTPENSAKQSARGAEKTKAPDWDFALLDASGRKHTAREWKMARAVALFFIGAECPISNRYAPEINRIVAAYSTRGVAFYGVQSDPDTSAAAALRHALDYGFDFPMLLDPAQTLASRTGVILTPTAVILSPAGELLYRGRIDDRNLDFGKYRDVGVKSDMRIALDAVIAGLPVPEKYTKPIGCALPPPAGQSTNHHAQ
ncbi:MAG: redoxin domain-containing protein [Chloracidobacterium sp.]|nr:redoxin domain-containing protein [Chloracidobacterium sp.]